MIKNQFCNIKKIILEMFNIDISNVDEIIILYKFIGYYKLF